MRLRVRRGVNEKNTCFHDHYAVSVGFVGGNDHEIFEFYTNEALHCGFFRLEKVLGNV